jgi:phage shock protein C
MSTQYKQLYRSRQGRVLGGVCAGLGEYFSIDPTLVRISFVLASILGWLGAVLLIYIYMWIIVPQSPDSIISMPHNAATPVDNG